MLPPLAVLLSLAGPSVTHPAVAPNAVLSAERQWQAVAACPRVVVGKNEAFASAVVVGQKDGFAYLLTSDHAIEPTVARAFQFFTRESYPEPARTIPGGTVVFRSAKPDFALVKLDIGKEPVPQLRLAKPGERPKKFPFAAVSVGCPFGLPPVSRAEDVMAKVLRRRSEEPEAFFWQVKVKPLGGQSGGPLLDAAGRVIGLCAASQDDRGYFTHLDEMLAGLKKEKHDWLWGD